MSVLAYFITFSTYGSWVHGDARGSVDRTTNSYGAPFLADDAVLMKHRRGLMTESPYRLDEERREVVLAAILQHARFRGWCLYAAHVRSTHVHTVVAADRTPERVMDELKAYASRALNQRKLDPDGRKRWTRHGSTRHLTSDESLQQAIRYTIDEQGEKMHYFELIETPQEPRPPGSGKRVSGSQEPRPRGSG